MSNRGFDPRKCFSSSNYQDGIELHEGTLAVPKHVNGLETEWEFWVSKLHWNFAHASAEDFETIKKIAQKL